MRYKDSRILWKMYWYIISQIILGRKKKDVREGDVDNILESLRRNPNTSLFVFVEYFANLCHDPNIMFPEQSEYAIELRKITRVW
jgi:hypothetical protein